MLYALAFANIAKIACKMGHFVSAKQCNVGHTQRVDFAHFFMETFRIAFWHTY